MAMQLVLVLSLLGCKKKLPTVPGGSTCLFESIHSELAPCLEEYSSETLEVLTWNLESFPLNGLTTIDEMVFLLCNIDADVVAVQEIKDHVALSKLAKRLDDWEMSLVDLEGDLDLGFLYKKSEITSITAPIAILPNTWPRPPIVTTVEHVSGTTTTLINLHLKCCGGTDNFNNRASVSQDLKEYIDSNLSDMPVIVLGDFNDHILANSPFENFKSDSEHYQFADMAIVLGSEENWSFPSWPSHIDHILISDELFDKVLFTKTIRIDQCLSGIESVVSDHRPLLVSIQ